MNELSVTHVTSEGHSRLEHLRGAAHERQLDSGVEHPSGGVALDHFVEEAVSHSSGHLYLHAVKTRHVLLQLTQWVAEPVHSVELWTPVISQLKRLVYDAKTRCRVTTIFGVFFYFLVDH